MVNSKPRHPFAVSVVQHINDSGMPESIKETLINRALFEFQNELLSLGELLDLPPIQKRAVPVQPPKLREVPKVSATRAKKSLEEQFVADWFDPVPTTKMRNVLITLITHLRKTKGIHLRMHFVSLTRQEAFEVPGVGETTWRYIQYLQEQLKD